jgi:dihydropteroate synthase
LTCAVWAVQAGVGIIRTHDVAATTQAVRMVEALQSYSS